jgi:5-formyltetrahydrofolate cyclo-ligase
MTNTHTSPTPIDTMPEADRAQRQQLRQRLRAAHVAWCEQPEVAEQSLVLSHHVATVLDELEPDCLGLYWPLAGEFDPRPLAQQLIAEGVALALPWAYKSLTGDNTGARMVFRPWDGQTPTDKDECGIPSPTGRETTPDVLLVPCIGVTRSGWRLGYGKGYYDNYLASYPHITAIGVAWSHALLSDEELVPQAHDQAMMLVVTPEGVTSPD